MIYNWFGFVAFAPFALFFWVALITCAYNGITGTDEEKKEKSAEAFWGFAFLAVVVTLIDGYFAQQLFG